MKTLIRWTIGPSVQEGIDALILSVRRWQSIFGNNFDFVICYNQINPAAFEQLKADGIKLVNQESYQGELVAAAAGPAWKLYPPRLNKGGLEIFIDNDLILLKAPSIILQYLDNKISSFSSMALRRSYGNFEEIIPQGLLINTGIFGIPADLDMKTELNQLLEIRNKKHWNSHFDEQGAIAKILSDKNIVTIPISEISVCYDHFTLGTHGAHFVGLNSGNTRYWSEFRQLKLF